MKIRYLLLIVYSGTLACMHNPRLAFHALGVPQTLVDYFVNPADLRHDEYGKTALMRAIIANNDESVRIILAQTRYDLLAHQDNAGNTALHYAVLNNNTRVIAHVLSLPEKFKVQLFNLRNKEGKTAAQLATDATNAT